MQHGGFHPSQNHLFDTSFTKEEDKPVPEREALLQEFIRAQHESGVKNASLLDAYGFGERFDSNTAIARHLGFAAAHFVPLEDERLIKAEGRGGGLVFATDHHIENSHPLDLETRQGISTVINLGGKAMQIVTAYFDDANASVRLRQTRALFANITPDIPTVVIGDFNTLHSDMSGASLDTRLHDYGIRVGAFACHLIPPKKYLKALPESLANKLAYYKHAIPDLNQRNVIPEFLRQGLYDANPTAQPTIRHLGLRACVDHAFLSPQLILEDFHTVPTGRASDHDGIRLRFTLAA